MNKENLNRLKKYLFLISLFFSLVIGGHISYMYLYSDASETPIEGGSVSEGIIGDFPHLNPLMSSNDYNKNIVSMLYRSLLKYDFDKQEIAGDLARCDIKNLALVECYLNDNVKWSNGQAITAQDIIATYNVIKNSEINPLIRSLIKDTTIEEKNGAIVFKNKIKDVNFLNVLMQPIVAKEVLDNIGNKELYGKFNPMDGLYSGPYKIENVSYDDNIGVQKLILSTNEHFSVENILVGKYIFRFFKDSTHFIKHKDTVNIFSDEEEIIGDSMPRLDSVSYFLKQYIALFLNENTIKNKELRSLVLEMIDTKNILKILGPGYQEVQTPYLRGESLVQDQKTLNIESVLKNLGYFKKESLTSQFLEQNKPALETKQKDIVNPGLATIKDFRKQNFNQHDDIVITGNVSDENIDAIYVNDTKLNDFQKGNKTYSYRLKISDNNIKLGENTYTISAGYGNEKKVLESFSLTLENDEKKLQELQNNFYKDAIAKNKEAQNVEINAEEKKKILALDDKFYYNTKFEKLTLKLNYIDSQKELADSANIIKNILQTYGISVQTEPISIGELTQKVKEDKKDYDLLLIGIDLGYFDYNLFPYFHSSQAKGGFNFSNIKNLELDVVLEELKTNILSEEERDTKIKKAGGILSQEKVIKPLFQKEKHVLIDKNIKNYHLKTLLPSDVGINEAIYQSFVSSEKQINWKQKGIIDFFHYIKKILTDDNYSKE